MDYDALQRKYLDDPSFSTLVNVLYSGMKEGSFSREEVKQAADLAALKVKWEYYNQTDKGR